MDISLPKLRLNYCSIRNTTSVVHLVDTKYILASFDNFLKKRSSGVNVKSADPYLVGNSKRLGLEMLIC